MNRYRELLAVRELRLLWIGSTASALGDGATWIALSWLVYERTQSPARVGLLVFAYGAPVLVGGLASGQLLDRFGAVRVMRLDSLVRGAVMHRSRARRGRGGAAVGSTTYEWIGHPGCGRPVVTPADRAAPGGDGPKRRFRVRQVHRRPSGPPEVARAGNRSAASTV
jgi:hypothetical protein